MGKIFQLECFKTGLYYIFGSFEDNLNTPMENILSEYNSFISKGGQTNFILEIESYKPFYTILENNNYKIEVIKSFKNEEYCEEQYTEYLENECKNLKCLNRYKNMGFKDYMYQATAEIEKDMELYDIMGLEV